MTQEDKELLLKDLCARLPYGVKAKYYDTEAERTTCDEIDDIYNTTSIDHIEIGIGQYGLYLTEIKPYLFPLSSMTDEQKKEESSFDLFKTNEVKTLGDWAVCLVDFYNKYHFDYHGLIEKGLALDATGLKIY